MLRYLTGNPQPDEWFDEEVSTERGRQFGQAVAEAADAQQLFRALGLVEAERGLDVFI